MSENRMSSLVTVAARVLLVLLATALLGTSLSACARPQADKPKPRPAKPAEQPSIEPTAKTEPTAQPDPAPAGTVTSVVPYFINDEKVYPAIHRIELPVTATVHERAVTALLRGPDASDRALGLTSAVPAGSRLLTLTVEKGTATVDLSKEFGSGGGSASMQMRVAQVVYTLTRFPDVRRVRFLLEGEPVEALGGEGLVLLEPQTRADYEDQTPSILVDTPAAGATVRTPLRIRGTANTFEAEFQLQVTDPNGRIVATKQVMATSGSGTRGTFDVTVPFTVPRDGIGEIVVWEVSAKDGSRIHIVETPVRMAR